MGCILPESCTYLPDLFIFVLDLSLTRRLKLVSHNHFGVTYTLCLPIIKRMCGMIFPLAICVRRLWLEDYKAYTFVRLDVATQTQKFLLR